MKRVASGDHDPALGPGQYQHPHPPDIGAAVEAEELMANTAAMTSSDKVYIYIRWTIC